MSDRLLRGLLPDLNARFALCEATELCTEAVTRHGSDGLSGWLLSEALTCGALASVMLKHEERLTLRWMYTGPVGTILVDAGERGDVRGFTAKVRLMPETETVSGALGKGGRISATTSLPNKMGPTGITEAPFADIPADLAHLFSLSFQVESALAVGLIVPPEAPLRLRSAIGVLLQPLPGADLERFEVLRQRVEHPALQAWMEEEPRGLEQLLSRVADTASWEVLDESQPQYRCNCSREKAEAVLRMIDRQELQDMLDEDGQAEITCHFCGERYGFTAEALKGLLRESIAGRG